MQVTQEDAGLPEALDCTIEGIEYFIGNDYMENTYAKLHLRIQEDEVSGLGHVGFNVDTPPTHLGHADFIVPKERFLQAMESNFKAGERCKVHSTHS